MKVFHIENFWGDHWDRLVGLVLDNGTYKVKMTPEDGGYNFIGEGYTDTGITITAANTLYIRNTVQTEYGCLPIPPYTGSDATFETDGFWANVTDVRAAVAGGDCVANNASCCGSRCLSFSTAATHATWGFGASLTLIGPCGIAAEHGQNSPDKEAEEETA